MPTVEVPDGARYVLIICTPQGDDATVEATWDERHLDAVTALEVIELAKADVTQQAATMLHQSSRRRLMQPLSAPRAPEPDGIAGAPPRSRGSHDGHHPADGS